MATYRLSIEGMALNQQVANVQHFRFVSGTDTGQALIDAWQANVRSAYVACLPQGYLMSRLVAVNIMNADRTEEADITPGTRGGELVPLQCAPIIAWTTGFALRRARGRTYLPGVVEADQAGGNVSAGLNLAMVAYANSMLAPQPFASLFELVIVSGLGFTYKVTNFNARVQIKTQRRRAVGVGS